MKTQIAVIGMGAILPGAMDFSEYWSNILSAKDCIMDIPESYWDLSEFYDPDPAAKDKTYGYRAGLVGYTPFDSIEFGIPPRVMESISIEQLFGLVVAKQALLDASMLGPDAKSFNREKTGVILASSVGKPAFSLNLRLQIHKIAKIMRNSNVPEHLIERVTERIKDSEFEWNEASHPGFLPNVAAGRIGNRFDLYGTNCTMDAACAGSLASLKYAIEELESGDCDIVLTGGVMMDTTPFTFVSFSKTPAIAPSNISRPFDEEADGMLLGDGIVMMVLKRLEDAERDKDRIYAVIESVSSSGDGRAKSIFAPRKEGQTLALQRAYGDAGINPKTVGMIEAHGTGTAVGDECEIEALTDYFNEFECEKKSILIGSVKSQIGHTRLTAGSASLMKAVLSVYHNVLPPTINVNTPNKKLFDSPFYLTKHPKPWIVNRKYPIRRAGVSAFGFGGTNFHVVIREYSNEHNFRRLQHSPAGLFFHAENKEKLAEKCRKAIDKLDTTDADYFNELVEQGDEIIPAEHVRLGMVAKDVPEAKEKLETALKMLEKSQLEEWHKKGIFYRRRGINEDAKVVSLFSGQGSQYTNMLSGVAVSYPEMRSMFETLDNTLLDMEKEPISQAVYPRTFSEEIESPPHLRSAESSTGENEKILADTRNTQPALAAVCGGLYRILKSRGYHDEYLIGHSFGEITALWAAEALDDAAYVQLAAARGEAMASAGANDTGMLAVFQDKEAAQSLITGYQQLYIANENSPGQTIVSGSLEQIIKLELKLQEKGVSAKRLNVSCAFHSPYMLKASEQFGKIIEKIKIKNLKKNVYSNTTAKLYPEAAEKVKQTLTRQITSSVLFKTSIENAYKDGARIFVEIGPGRTLTTLTEQILDGKEFQAIAVNPDKTGDSHEQLEYLFTQLKVLGMDIKKDPYFSPLRPKKTNADSKTTYMLPPFHFFMDDTAKRMDDAINHVDPLPESPAENAGEKLTEGMITDQGPVPDENPQPAQNMIQYKTARAKLNGDNGEVIMGKIESKNYNNPVMKYAYELQSLNKDMFQQFTQSQEIQMDKFKEIVRIDNSASNNHLKEMMRFIEMFQSNSMKAYETYFAEQSRLMNGMSGNISDIVDYGNVHENDMLQTETEHFIESTQDFTESAQDFNGSTQDFTESMNDTDEKQISGVFTYGTTAVKIEKRIIEVISDRTGYPIEMIDPDMNIESDLGIDSIRRVEILSILNDEMEKGFTQEDLKMMSTLHTIEEFAQFLEKKFNTDEEEEEAVIDPKAISGFLEQNELDEENLTGLSSLYREDETTEEDERISESEQDIKRYRVCSQEIDKPSDGIPVIAGEGLVLLTRDQEGLSEEIGQNLKEKGYRVVYVSFPWQKEDLPQTYRMQEISDASIKNIYCAIEEDQDMPLAGFIHVADPQKAKQDICKVFDYHEAETLKAVFLFAKYFKHYVLKPVEGKNFFITIARMDGRMGMSTQQTGAVLQGGLFGLVKSLHREWKSVCCKVIDIASECDKVSAGNLAAEEIFDSEEIFIETARDLEGKRFTNIICEKHDDIPAKELPGPDDVFLVTGGGRGITARCVLQFAKEYRSKFILLGRSSVEQDLSWTMDETDPDKLRPLLLNHLKKTGQAVKPGEIDGILRDAMNQIEILNTIEQIRQAGGKAVYITCDIRNGQEVGRAILSGTNEMGSITGFIHGAGTIADKDIDQKTEQDFNKVFETKVRGLEFCLKDIAPEQLKYMVLFSSVSAYFGNQGQTDYAMANEFLNKFAYEFKKIYPEAFTLAIDWGPWEGGMVSEGLKLILLAKGEIMIPYNIGAGYFSEQFRYSLQPEDCQMVISGTDQYISHELDFDLLQAVNEA